MNWLWSRLESPVSDVASLRARNLWLACIHVVLFTASAAVVVIVVARVRELVTLTQRSNVETLTLLIVVALLVFLMLSTGQATLGAVLLLASRALPRDVAQRWMHRRAVGMRKTTSHSYIDAVVVGAGDGPIELPIEDDYGRLGVLRLDRADVTLAEISDQAASAITQLVVRALGEHGRVEGLSAGPRVVFWNGIDEDRAHAYFAQVAAFDRLQHTLGADRLWPRVVLDGGAVRAIGRMLREAAPAIREDLLMPDIEYSADFSIPIVPQPLAFVQLRRSAERADPVAAMGCSALIALLMLVVIAYVVVDPPWVPGK